jgi:hypothetical protein
MFTIKPCIICQCNKYLKLAHTYNVAASLYCCCKGVTSALVLSCFERQRAQRFIKQVYRCNQWLKINQDR